jgi:hypothetical protein
LGHPVRAIQVDFDHPTELFWRFFEGRHRGSNARVIYKDVDPAKCRNGSNDSACALRGIGHIELEDQGLLIPRLDPIFCFLKSVQAPGGEHQGGTSIGESIRERYAQA